MNRTDLICAEILSLLPHRRDSNFVREIKYRRLLALHEELAILRPEEAIQIEGVLHKLRFLIQLVTVPATN